MKMKRVLALALALSPAFCVASGPSNLDKELAAVANGLNKKAAGDASKTGFVKFHRAAASPGGQLLLIYRVPSIPRMLPENRDPRRVAQFDEMLRPIVARGLCQDAANRRLLAGGARIVGAFLAANNDTLHMMAVAEKDCAGSSKP